MRRGLTPQEMFDRAYRGLRAQGFRHSEVTEPGGVKRCVYDDGAGRRCAWGHVDLSLTSIERYGVLQLRERGIGLAAGLDPDGLELARALQRAHDLAWGPDVMRANLEQVAREHGLTVPPEDGR